MLRLKGPSGLQSKSGRSHSDEPFPERGVCACLLAYQPTNHPRTPTDHPTPRQYLYRAQLDERLDRFAFLRIAAAQAAVRHRARGENDTIMHRE